MPVRIITATAVFCLIAIVILPVVCAANNIFWTNKFAKKIYAADEATGEVQIVRDANGLIPAQLEGIATDGQYLYYSDGIRNDIVRSNFDGSGYTVLVNGPTQGDFDYLYQGVAVDSQSIYWTDGFSDSLNKSNLDGTHAVELIDLPARFGGLPASYAPTAVTAADGRVYWIDLNRHIYVADTNGSNASAIVDLAVAMGADAYDLRGLTLANDSLYWTFSSQSGRAGIYRANLDGSDPMQVVDIVAAVGGDLHAPKGIATDGRRLYWVDISGIYRSNLDGTQLVNVVSGIGGNYIAVIAIPEPTALALLCLGPICLLRRK